MRYVLTFGGLAMILFGGAVEFFGTTHARPPGYVFALLGFFPMVIGMATIDIVAAIQRTRN